MHRILPGNHQDAADQHDRGKQIKEKWCGYGCHILCWSSATLDVRISTPNPIGSRTFHPICMSWSKRYRGNVPRYQIYMYMKPATFAANQKTSCTRRLTAGTNRTRPINPRTTPKPASPIVCMRTSG